MKTEIIRTQTVLQTVGGKSCKDCDEEEAQKKLLEQRLIEEDRVSLSGVSPLEARIASLSSEGGLGNNQEGENPASKNQAAPRTEADLSQEERQALTELKIRDREVRAHEQAHLAAAGPYAKGPPSFEFQTGPDGKPYAVGGEVQIDTSEVSGNPQATLTKAQIVKRAATAPRNPSAQDRQVAAQASRMEAEARKEIREQRSKDTGQAGATGTPTAASATSPTLSTKATQQTSETAQPAGEKFSKTNAASSFGANSRLQKTLQLFSSPTEKGRLLDIVS